jgi:DNA polymerase-3 subunit alpha
MAFLRIDTLEGPCEVTAFSEVFEQRRGIIEPDAVVMVKGKVNHRNGTAGLLAVDILPTGEVEDRLTTAVHINLPGELDEAALTDLAGILGDSPGACDVYLHCLTEDAEEVTVHATSACRVAATPELRARVARLVGEDALWLSGDMGLVRHN